MLILLFLIYQCCILFLWSQGSSFDLTIQPSSPLPHFFHCCYITFNYLTSQCLRYFENIQTFTLGWNNCTLSRIVVLRLHFISYTTFCLVSGIPNFVVVLSVSSYNYHNFSFGVLFYHIFFKWGLLSLSYRNRKKFAHLIFCFA